MLQKKLMKNFATNFLPHNFLSISPQYFEIAESPEKTEKKILKTYIPENNVFLYTRNDTFDK